MNVNFFSNLSPSSSSRYIDQIYIQIKLVLFFFSQISHNNNELIIIMSCQHDPEQKKN